MALQDITTLPPEEKNRKTGIDAVGAVPWGTHLCCFYDTKQDLIDILVPYFKAGLENNESCIWVTSKTPDVKEAEKAMRKAVPDFAQYLERGQIEIIPHTDWYLKDGVFNQQRVLSAWIDKLNRALATGYDGMRVTGNTSWLEKRDWEKFTDYEEEVNNVIGKYRMLAICTYSLGSCGASEILDVASKHQSALIKQAGDWVLTRSSERKQAEESQGMNSPAQSREQGPLTPLQKRFIKSGLEGFNDKEVVELLLSLYPCGRQSQIRKRVSKAFKNVRELLSASPQELRQAGLPPRAITYIRLMHDIPAQVLREKIFERSVYASSQEIFDYLYYSMRDLKKEVFKVIYLNKRDQIIDVVDLFEGTLDIIPIRPREIVDSAIKHNASFLIFVHNHPSGDPAPSRTDKQLTRDLVFIGNVLQIRVLDHIIIGENRYFSFADEGLIQKYEDDFLNIKIRRI